MENIENKIGVAYCRVSTSDQKNNGLSIEEQERLCVEKAEREGYSIIEIIKDEGKSGGSLNREGIKKIMQLVVDKKINAIFTVHSDRIARNTENYLRLRTLFQNNDVKLFFIQLPNLDNSASSKMMDTMLASFNQYHRDVTAEKVTLTMEGKARLGYFPGYSPIGYKNVNNPDKSVVRAGHKIIVIDEKMGPLVVKAFELYATGNYSVYDVGEIIYEQGLRTRRNTRLSDSRLYDLLRNHTYIGEVHWGSIHNKNGNHKPLIDKDLFDRVQKMLVIKNNHACRKRKHKWLLSGYLYCYKHQCRYTAEWHLGKKIAYYHCPKGGCGKYIEQSKMEEMVKDQFRNIRFSKEFIDDALNGIKKMFYDKREIFEKKRKSLVNQRTAFEAKRKVAEEKLLERTIDSDTFSRMNKEILEEIQNIDEQLNKLDRERSIDIDLAKDVMEFSKNIYSVYSKGNFRLQREILGFFWSRFEIQNGIIIKSTPSTLFDHLVRVEQAYHKIEKPYNSIGSQRIISLDILSAR